MGFFQFLVSKNGLRHILRIVLLYLVLAGAIWLFLRWYTDHGEYASVPDLRGMTVEDASVLLSERGLSYLIVDSIYDAHADPGSILDQSPAPESQVKEGRQVFLTVYRVQPPMEVLNIEEGEFGQVAIIKLKNKGIKYDIRYVPSSNMVGSVISISYKGKTLRPGDTIRRGEHVVLTVGEASDQNVQLPDLTGMSYADAMVVLDSLNLMGQGFFEPEPMSAQDSALFRVCRQDPEFTPDAIPVAPGRIIDFWLSKEPCFP